MKHPQWSEIYFYFKEFQVQKNQLESKKITSDILATTLTSLESSMTHLKNNLKQTLDEQSVHLIIFALSALLDEEIQRIVLKTPGNVEWIPLQKKLFNLANAGEVFFENLDEVLESNQFSSIVYEVYYFVLKKGFRGKYEHSPNRLAKYLEFLGGKVKQPTIAKKDKTINTIQPLPKIKYKVWHYYAVSVVVLLCAYITFAIQTNVT